MPNKETLGISLLVRIDGIRHTQFDFVALEKFQFKTPKPVTTLFNQKMQDQATSPPSTAGNEEF